ncbi:hypothetical protein ACHAWF_008441 [Thalassiosira exigua]
MAAAFAASSSASAVGASAPKQLSLDHLVYVVPDLPSAVADLERRAGVRPSPGGRHLGLGTHNAFLSLGDGRYLELFAPDPDAEVPLKRIIGVDGPGPRLSTFCCRTPEIDALVDGFKTLRSADADENNDDGGERPDYEALLPTSVASGSRTNEADGSTISWRIASGKHEVPSSELPLVGLLPFYIDWGDSMERGIHPSVSAPQGCTLVSLEAYHPRPKLVEKVWKEGIGWGLDALASVREGEEVRLVATIDTPNGRIELF